MKARKSACRPILCSYLTLGFIAFMYMYTYVRNVDHCAVKSEILRPVANILPLCLEHPGTLVGLIVTPRNTTDVAEVRRKHATVKLGGEWDPTSCRALQKIAIIIPFRDRHAHLIKLLDNLHSFLQRQQHHYRIVVVEQMGRRLFNKGLLFNTGFAFVNRTFADVDCLVLHDVDMIPLDDRNLYSCRENPRHLSVAVDILNFTLPYVELVGGVLNLKPRDFVKVNGFSNLYWGWGAEDDDFYYRMTSHGLKVDRPPVEISRYTMLHHRTRRQDATDWQSRGNLLKQQRNRDRSATDGITSLKTRIHATDVHKLYTHLMVDVENHQGGVLPTVKT